MAAVAVLGLGRMGRAIGARLVVAGHDVRVWNRTPGPERELVEAGARWCASAAEAVKDVDIACTALRDGEALREVVIGGGLTGAMRSGATLVDFSTVDVATSAQVAQECAAAGVGYLRSPVSGNPAVVAAGNAALLVSGPAALLEQHRDVLADIGPKLRHVGEAEEARVVKLCVNLMLAGVTELLAEAVVLAEASSVRRETLLEALSGSVMASPFLEYKSSALRKADYTPTFTTQDMRKDVALALGQAAATDVPLPATQLLAELFDDAIAAGFGSLDFLSLVPRLQARAGVAADVSPADET